MDKGITISGGGKSKVLSVRHGATLVNLTITGGKAIGFDNAGGIESSGPLVLDHSTVSGNQGLNGGGIRGDTIRLTNSTVANNSVPGQSGFAASAIDYAGDGTLTLINSTVAHNTGGFGALARFGRIVPPRRTPCAMRSFPTILV